MFSGTWSLLPAPTGVTALPGTWTPNQALPAGTPLVSGTWTPSQAQAIATYYGYPTSAYNTGAPTAGGGSSFYQQPGSMAEETELSKMPLKRRPGLFGEEFNDYPALAEVFKSRGLALAAIGVLSVLILKGR